MDNRKHELEVKKSNKRIALNSKNQGNKRVVLFPAKSNLLTVVG